MELFSIKISEALDNDFSISNKFVTSESRVLVVEDVDDVQGISVVNLEQFEISLKINNINSFF